MMSPQGWQPIDSLTSGSLSRTIWLSVGLHAVLAAALLIYPIFHKPVIRSIPVFEVVSLQKPKVRLLKPKVKPVVKPRQKPSPKRAAPRLTRNPEKALIPDKPVEVKSKPDTHKVDKVVEEVPEETTPRMLMAEMSDPRLKNWLRRVKKIIDTRWNPPGGIGIIGYKEASIDFKVNRSGVISDVAIGGSSGNNDLDDIALNTILRVGHLPSIPLNYRDKDILSIRFQFPYSGD